MKSTARVLKSSGNKIIETVLFFTRTDIGVCYSKNKKTFLYNTASRKKMHAERLRR